MKKRGRQYLHCPLCGMEFQKTDTICAHGCPMSHGCNLVCCPNCNYEFPDTPRLVTWLQRLFRRRREHPRPANGTTLTLDRFRAGERGTLQKLACEDSSRRNMLTVFGLVPGTEVTLIQRHPSFVIRVGETELGLDREIAREIVLKLA